MKIERDISLIRQKDPVVLSGKNDELAGMLVGRRVYLLSPNDLLNTVALYCHEFGHYLGQRFSYQQGLNGLEPEVLSFTQIREEQTVIELTAGQVSCLVDYIKHPGELVVDQTALGIGDRLLTAFTMGKFNPGWLTVEPVSALELQRLREKHPSQTTRVSAGDQKVALNSRNGRDQELAATMTEAACLQILENTLKANHLLPAKQLIMFKTGSPAHQRARNLVSRSHDRCGWRLPSDLDLKKKRT